MLDKPNISDSAIGDCLRGPYGLPVQKITFLPLGAERNTAVYRADATDGLEYFVRLRINDFNEMSLEVPKRLNDHSVPHIIAPLTTRDGKLWLQVNEFYLSVYPFIHGRNAHESGLTDEHWVELGRTLKGIHTVTLPADVVVRIPKETFSSRWRDKVRQFQRQIEVSAFDDPVSTALKDLLQKKQAIVDELVQRAERLGQVLQDSPPPFVLCHADIHAWNMHVQSDGTFYVVDWDTIMLAPKERDLMFVAGGLFGNARSPEQEEKLFYRGYGDQSLVNPVDLAYYRCERIVQDIAAYCEEIFLTEPGGENRAQGLKHLRIQFEPGQVIDIALRKF